MIGLLSSDHTEGDDHYQKFHLSGGSCLHAARLWDGIVLWGNEIRLDKLSSKGAYFQRFYNELLVGLQKLPNLNTIPGDNPGAPNILKVWHQ